MVTRNTARHRFPQIEGVRPTFGPKYAHFTDDEVRWLTQTMGTNTKNALYMVRCWRKVVPSLKAYESWVVMEQLSPSELPSLVKANLKIYPVWLANYGRITLSLDYLVPRRLRFTWPSDSNALVNSALLDHVWDVCVNQLRHSEEATEQFIIPALVRLLLWSGQPLKQAVECYDEFEASLSAVATASIASPAMGSRLLRTALYHMGYDVTIPIRSGKVSATGKLLTTKHADLISALELYREYVIRTKRIKTVRTLLSHIRTFVNWLDDDYPLVDNLSALERDHIREYLAFLDGVTLPSGKPYGGATKNHKVQALHNWLEWLRHDHPCLGPRKPLVTPIDFTAEPVRFPERISQSEANRLFEVVAGIDETRWFQEKMVLLLLADTGARVHEVMHLGYDCLVPGEAGPEVVFHKRKGNILKKPAGKLTIEVIQSVQRYNSRYAGPLYSPFDNTTVRRLFVSDTGRTLLSQFRLREVFSEEQITAGMVDKHGRPRFTLHDFRRVYVAALESSGAPEDLIRKLTGHKNPKSLLPYEVHNARVAKVFHRMEASGVLIGKDLPSSQSGQDSSPLEIAQREIMNLLRDANIRRRQADNLAYRMRNPEESWPLMCGTCVASAEVDCLKDDLGCLGCAHFKLTNLHMVDDYLKRVFHQQ